MANKTSTASVNKKASAKTANHSKLGITDVVLRDAHQSLLATRMRTEDMLPVASQLDDIGFWSLEVWGGATFDACLRYLGEDPWERLRKLKQAITKTPLQMLLRGQNLLGYRHYADDVVTDFVKHSAANGIEIFRIFDAMNDPRNLKTAIQAVNDCKCHAQAAMSYTISPVHTLDSWVELALRYQDMQATSIAIKDMAGLLEPYVAFELVTRLKEVLEIPLHMQCHATTGLSTTTIIKAVEAGIDNVDTAISSMSMTYGHSATETVVAILQDNERDTKLDLSALSKIADYFREVRKKYARYEGSLRGVDARILEAQVPGGMLSNLENQLREQQASDRFGEVIEEIPKVRKDLGYIPLVTPTSQIVGTQAVLNVLSGERYKNISKEVAGVLKGEYGATPTEVNAELQKKVLDGGKLLTKRPADNLEPEMQRLRKELDDWCKTNQVELPANKEECVLSYALLPQVATKFFRHKDDPTAFEDKPSETPPASTALPEVQVSQIADGNRYTVSVDGQEYQVLVTDGSAISTSQLSSSKAISTPAVNNESVVAPLSGTVLRINVDSGTVLAKNEVVMVLEAMKMETELKIPAEGQVTAISVSVGDEVATGQELFNWQAS